MVSDDIAKVMDLLDEARSVPGLPERNKELA